MAVQALVVKAATAVLADEKGRKTVGWILVAILSPVIVLMVLTYTVMSGVVSENALILESVFYEAEISSALSDDIQQSITTMLDCFAVMEEQIEEENLDENRIKSIFYLLYFGSDEQALDACETFATAFLADDLQTVYQTIEDNFIDGTNTTWQTDSQTLYEFLQTGESFYTLVAGLSGFVEPVTDWESSVSDDKPNVHDLPPFFANCALFWRCQSHL